MVRGNGKLFPKGKLIWLINLTHKLEMLALVEIPFGKMPKVKKVPAAGGGSSPPFTVFRNIQNIKFA